MKMPCLQGLTTATVKPVLVWLQAITFGIWKTRTSNTILDGKWSQTEQTSTQQSMSSCLNQSVLQRSFKDLRRFLSEDPSSSSFSVHFQIPKNLQSFEDFRPKIAKIFWENLTIFWTKLSEKVQKYVFF